MSKQEITQENSGLEKKESESKKYQGSPIRKWVLGTMTVSLVSVSIILGFYNLYLNGAEQHNVSGLAREYDQLSATLVSMKEQMDQDRQARVRTAQTLDHLADSLSRYQDNLGSIQTELVKLRYDVNTVQKMPQFEVGHRMEVLSILATDVSIEYARQKLVLGRNFDAAIAQLKQARERLAISDENHLVLLRVLDDGVMQLEKLQVAYNDTHILKRLGELTQQAAALPFKKTLQTQEQAKEDQQSVQTQSSWGSGLAQYFQHSLAELKSAFVIRKGQQLDLTTLTSEGEARCIDHLKIFLQRAEEAYDLGDSNWYQHQLESAQHLAKQYLDDGNEKVKTWLRELQSLEQESVGLDEARVNSIFNALKKALGEGREHMPGITPETQATASEK